MKRKVLALTILGAACAAGTVVAIQQDIEIAARMRIGLSFANKVDMNFTPSTAHIDYYGTPSAAADQVEMGTDGAMAVNGTKLQPSTLTGTPGSVDINGDATSFVDITCDAAATLEEPGGELMTVDNLQLAIDTGVAYGNGASYACSGVNSVTPLAHQLDGTDKIIVGGRLVANASTTTALYTTNSTNGVPATVKVLYH